MHGRMCRHALMLLMHSRSRLLRTMNSLLAHSRDLPCVLLGFQKAVQKTDDLWRVVGLKINYFVKSNRPTAVSVGLAPAPCPDQKHFRSIEALGKAKTDFKVVVLVG